MSFNVDLYESRLRRIDGMDTEELRDYVEHVRRLSGSSELARALDEYASGRLIALVTERKDKEKNFFVVRKMSQGFSRIRKMSEEELSVYIAKTEQKDGALFERFLNVAREQLSFLRRKLDPAAIDDMTEDELQDFIRNYTGSVAGAVGRAESRLAVLRERVSVAVAAMADLFRDIAPAPSGPCGCSGFGSCSRLGCPSWWRGFLAEADVGDFIDLAKRLSTTVK